jgi:adenylate cyclase
MFDYQNRWTENPDNSLPIAKQYALQAIEKDPNEPLARCVAALAASYERDLDRAMAEVDKAISLNPNLALAHNIRGTLRSFAGQPLEAIPEIEQAIRLDPTSSMQSLHFLGMAYLLAGKYETAVTLLKQRILLVPGTDFSRVLLACALGHLGEREEARRVWGELKTINPNYSLAEHIGRQPFARPQDVARIVDGLAAAGLPD